MFPPRAWPVSFRLFSSLFLLFFGLIFGGCASAPATSKIHPAATIKLAQAKSIAIAPIDAELSELTASGVLEPRMEWTAAASRNLMSALGSETGFTEVSLTSGPVEVATELEAVQALMRTFTVHRVGTAIAGRADPFATNNQTLDYHTGALVAFPGPANADLVLFVFIRDSFASAGRKSMVALSVVGAALTGVAIVPQMGATVMSAALVDRDGTVLWFNHSTGGHDPRTLEGARLLVHELLKDLPKKVVR